MTAKNNRVGEENFNRFGRKMTIIEYNNAFDIIVMFDDGFIVKSIYRNFKSGKIKNPYDKSVFGVGYLGENIDESNTNNSEIEGYQTWRGMLRRCYEERYKNKYGTYKDCETDEEWHNFQNFSKWYEDNYYSIGDEEMHLDKDILIKGNKIYSPNTCIFVPRNINMLFGKKSDKTNNLPIGVSFDKSRNKYKSTGNNGFGKLVYLGRFNTSEEAFNVYKTFKEKVIKEVAEHYKNRIPSKLYDALVSYEVEIDD